MKYSKFLIILLLLFSFFVFGCIQSGTFEETNNSICEIDGKVVVRMYSTTWCPHCEWVSPVFDSVVKDYQEKGLIVAHHWEVDILDDKLTEIVEGSISEEEYAEFLRISPNGSVPAFSFGCKYVRIGNGYESSQDLVAEEKEFREIIEKLIAEKI